MLNFHSVLQGCPLFRGLESEELSAILACLGAKRKDVPKGQAVFHEGEPATHMGIVLTGAVRLIREDYYGNRSIVAHIEAGQLFGESYACAELATLPVSVIADEDSQLLLLDCRRITVCCSQACAFHSRVIFNLLRLVATKNLLFDQKIQVTSKRSTREKLMTYLMQCAKQEGSDRFEIPFDRQELADYLEVDRSGLSAEISKLRREGILACEKNRFTLL